MQTAKDLKEYKAELKEALDNEFLRTAMDNFAVAYRGARARAFSGIDVDGLIGEIAEAKDQSVARMMELFEEFRENAEKHGTQVHLARTAMEANAIISRIATENGVKKVVKSKSMTAEETLLNHHLEKHVDLITETDLGEWIIQLRSEGPTHMVMPAIHLSRYQVADLFSGVTQKTQDHDIQKLVKVARRELRRAFVEADMGISGANFAIAESGSLGILTNEGNGRLVTTLPKIHVALVGLEKLTPTLHDALRIIKALPRNATGQAITSYVTWITGPVECAAAQGGGKIQHVVFLDNGRLKLSRDKDFSQVLRCVRCGACANVCPVYRLVGGHKYGHIYIGAVGLVLTYFLHGRDKARNLVQNCLNCGACKDVCAAGIDLPRLIKEVHARIRDEDGHPLQTSLLGKVMKNRGLFHSLIKTASIFQKTASGKGGTYLRHLPMFFARGQEFRMLPAVADKPFRVLWPHIRPGEAAKSGLRIALFSGCAQDFVYPEQPAAAVRLLKRYEVGIDYPMEQSCCGLPLLMLGEKDAAADIALNNIRAIFPGGFDYILTMCASCASHLKSYARIFENDARMAAPALEFSKKVIDFSSFMHDVLKIKAEDFEGESEKVAFHAPCHLCRGLKVKAAPRELIATAGYEYAPAEEEEVCCGFGGSFSMKFPELSAEILKKKLNHVLATGAKILTTDCPGCIMQLRGGLEKMGAGVKVRHTAELLAWRLKS